MKKITTGLVLLIMSGASHSATMTSATFTIYDDTGQIVPFDTGPVASVTGSIGAAHSGTTFGPGTYAIDTIEGGIYNFTVGEGQLGGHILWDWSTTTDMDIVNVWDVSTVAGVTSYTSTDIDGDGIPGIGFIDGPFATVPLSANFDFSTAVPIPAAVWLFGSGLVGLIGVARRKKA